MVVPLEVTVHSVAAAVSILPTHLIHTARLRILPRDGTLPDRSSVLFNYGLRLKRANPLLRTPQGQPPRFI